MKALHPISHSVHKKTNGITKAHTSWFIHLHLVASLVEVDRVLTNDGSHFLLFSRHVLRL